MERIIEFLKEYEELCKKYDMWISACGCCNSPYLVTRADEGLDIGYINFSDREKKVIFSVSRYENGKSDTEYAVDIEQLKEIVNKG